MSIFRNGLFAALALFALSTAATPCFAWGDEGHEIIGLIAVDELKHGHQKVLDDVRKLLGSATDDLAVSDTGDIVADNAPWADKYRDSDRSTSHPVRYSRTHNWHFVDIELDGSADEDAACNNHPDLAEGTPASEGNADDCVVDKIDQFSAELADAATGPAERLMALRFLLHFVGDLHQPLHAIDDHDAGGNGKRLRGAGLKSNKLHHHWDTTFVEDQGPDAKSIATALEDEITDADRDTWTKGSPATWAEESFRIAKKDAYGRLPKEPDAHGTYVLTSTDYITHADADVRLQLKRAGVRLAAILEKALDH